VDPSTWGVGTVTKLHEYTEVWVFSTDSYAWTEPLRGKVTDTGTTSIGREWARITLPDERQVLVAGHRDLLLRRPEPGRPTYIDVYRSLPSAALDEALASNPDQWCELYASEGEAVRVAKTVRDAGLT